MLQFLPITTDVELQQILDLQAINLADNLTPEQIAEQGFLTMRYDFSTIKQMNDTEQGILIKDGDAVAGYILAMSKKLRNAVPELVPMFDTFDHLYYKNKPLNNYNYIVIGQICIAEAYRGKHLFDRAYAAYRALLSSTYDFTITEVSKRNLRSMNAHKRVGFQVINEFEESNGAQWNIVLWDWRE